MYKIGKTRFKYKVCRDWYLINGAINTIYFMMSQVDKTDPSWEIMKVTKKDLQKVFKSLQQDIDKIDK